MGTAKAIVVTVAVLGAVGCSSHGSPKLPRAVSRVDFVVPNPQDDTVLLGALRGLSDSPSLRLLVSTPVQFLLASGEAPDYRVHPQGMTWIPGLERWAVTAVETREDRRRVDDGSDPNGKGAAHVFFLYADGRCDRKRTVTLPKNDAYHPGGIDRVGKNLVFPVSPYFPNSRAQLISMNAFTGAWESIAQLDDHLGIVGVVEGRVLAANWDAERLYVWGDGAWRGAGRNTVPLAFQDGQGVGRTHVIWTGLGVDIFGMSLFKFPADSGPVEEQTWTWRTDSHRTTAGHAPFRNPTFMWVDPNGRLLVATLPGDQRGRFRTRPHGTTREVVENDDEAQAFVSVYEIR